MPIPEPRPTLQIGDDGSVGLGPDLDRGGRIAAADALVDRIEAGGVPPGRALSLAVAAAMALCVRDLPDRFALDVALERLRIVADGCGDRGVGWTRARMREVMDVTPPADRTARLFLEARLVEGDLRADERMLTRHLLALLRQSAGVRPGRPLTVLADAPALAPGLDDPGPLVQAARLARAEGVDVRLSPPGDAGAVLPAGLMLVTAALVRRGGDVLVETAAAGAIAESAAAGIPVRVLLTAGRVDWADRMAAPAGTALLPAGLLSGYVSERGACAAGADGLAALYPEQDRTPPVAIANDA